MEELMNRIGEVYEPFKVHFLHKPVRPLAPDEVLVKVRASAICTLRAGCTRPPRCL